jgi:hypothetical protein
MPTVICNLEEVGKGHHQGMKYLFEMIGLYPATGLEQAAGTEFDRRHPVTPSETS